jgi:cyanate permease
LRLTAARTMFAAMRHDHHPDRVLWRDAAIIVILALAPAIGVGIARFSYSLLLPDMRASLGWSYAAAGFMNTVNAAGYLIGALAAAGAIRRIGESGAIFYGSLVCVIALALSAASENFLVLSAARLRSSRAALRLRACRSATPRGQRFSSASITSGPASASFCLA